MPFQTLICYSISFQVSILFGNLLICGYSLILCPRFLNGPPIVLSNWPSVPTDFNISWFCTHILTSINWVPLTYDYSHGSMLPLNSSVDSTILRCSTVRFLFCWMCRYEAVFYAALGLVLMAWILYENTLLYRSKMKRSSSKAGEDNIILDSGDRCLQLSDMRIPLTFVSYAIFCCYVFFHHLNGICSLIYISLMCFSCFRWSCLMLHFLGPVTLQVLQALKFHLYIGS